MILRKLLGFLCVLYLVFCLFFSAVCLLIARGFHGMGTASTYERYVPPSLLIVLSIYWLFTAFVRLSANAALVLFCGAIVVSIWLLTTMASSKEQMGSVVVAGILALSFWASWYVRHASTSGVRRNPAGPDG